MQRYYSLPIEETNEQVPDIDWIFQIYEHNLVDEFNAVYRSLFQDALYMWWKEELFWPKKHSGWHEQKILI